MTGANDLQFLAGIRDGALSLSKSLLKKGLVTSKAMLEAICIALDKDELAAASLVWKWMSRPHRHRALKYGVMWDSACEGSPRATNWVLKKAGMTAESRTTEDRHYNKSLIRSMSAAMRRNDSICLRVLWDKSTWTDWKEALDLSFEKAIHCDNIRVIEKALQLSIAEPGQGTFRKIIIEKLNGGGLMKWMDDNDRKEMLRTIYQFFADEEIDVWLTNCPCGCYTAPDRK